MDVINIPVVFKNRKAVIDSDQKPEALVSLQNALYADAKNNGNVAAEGMVTQNVRRILDLYADAYKAQASRRGKGFNFVHDFRLRNGNVIRIGDTRSLLECAVLETA